MISNAAIGQKPPLASLGTRIEDDYSLDFNSIRIRAVADFIAAQSSKIFWFNTRLLNTHT